MLAKIEVFLSFNECMVTAALRFTYLLTRAWYSL